MNRRPDPLDPNERELADLFSRDALPGPSPQLDARILAAARAAAEPATAPRRPRPRWIAGMALAATLVLAVGIAWRLRPMHERPMVTSIPAAVRVGEARDDAAASAAAEVGAPPMESQPRELPEAGAAEPGAPPQRKPASPPEPPVVFDQPSPMDTQAPPPAPPPPAPVPVPQAVVANGVAASAPAPAAPAAPPATLPDAFPQARQKAAGSLDRVQVTGSRIERNVDADAAAAADAAAEDGVSREVLDEEPPATADSPQVRDAWLQRIRELLAAGETEAARNSLAEFRKRYPKYALPEDLGRIATP